MVSLLLASEYVLATKDTDFLWQRITYHYKADRAPAGEPDRSVLQVLADAYEYLSNHTGARPYNRPCAQQYVGKSQSCMVISGRL